MQLVVVSDLNPPLNPPQPPPLSFSPMSPMSPFINPITTYMVSLSPEFAVYSAFLAIPGLSKVLHAPQPLPLLSG